MPIIIYICESLDNLKFRSGKINIFYENIPCTNNSFLKSIFKKVTNIYDGCKPVILFRFFSSPLMYKIVLYYKGITVSKVQFYLNSFLWRYYEDEIRIKLITIITAILSTLLTLCMLARISVRCPHTYNFCA